MKPVWPDGQVVKTGASHAPIGSSTLPRVTTIMSTISSAGRAPDSKSGCPGFESLMVYHPCGVPRGSIVGVSNGEGPPVPIPNTEVKLTSADNTCLETDREDRSMPTQKAATIRLRLFAVYCMVIWAQFS